ncbi:Zinc transporter ZIP1 [Amphibalanus amphitrite]|uniref:Zinc transporter ZIP1 n=1 Tax=Amphibalanus amphitrite TaxID=1232801 RepID=A0A6A4WM47_AMPAM|nr:Zinc transporter ZIP1 [Amphibalanus amphitrite]
MTVLAAKLGALAILFSTSLLLGLLPFPLRPWLRQGTGRSRAARLAISCLQCLGGGVLLATVLTHMLPEIRESLEAGGRGGDFPLAEVLLCAGMFSIYAVEEVAMLLSPQRDEGEDGDRSPILQPRRGTDKAAEAAGAAARAGYGTVPSSSSAEANGGHGHSHSLVAAAGGGPTGLASFRVLIVTAALSVHSVFEGVAIGLEPSEPSVWLLTAAIATHKAIIAFCLGEQLAATQRRLRSAIVSLTIFVAAAPIGILIGILVISSEGDDVDTQAFATDVLQSLAAGTILYVVFFEIIQGERAKPGGGLLKLLAILAGFGIMLLVTSFLQEPDDDQPTPLTPVTDAT